MKIKINNQRYSAEIELKDNYFDLRYSNNGEYVHILFERYISLALGNLYSSRAAQEILNKLETEITKERIRIAQKGGTIGDIIYNKILN